MLGNVIIRNKKFATQFISFDGLTLYGTIYPTDIDGFIEIHDKVFIYIEVKHHGEALPHGQQKALMRAVDSHEDSGKESIIIIAYHSSDGNQDIYLADCYVYRVYTKRNWRKLPVDYTVQQFINAYKEKLERMKILP